MALAKWSLDFRERGVPKENRKGFRNSSRQVSPFKVHHCMSII